MEVFLFTMFSNLRILYRFYDFSVFCPKNLIGVKKGAGCFMRPAPW